MQCIEIMSDRLCVGYQSCFAIYSVQGDAAPMSMCYFIRCVTEHSNCFHIQRTFQDHYDIFKNLNYYCASFIQGFHYFMHNSSLITLICWCFLDKVSLYSFFLILDFACPWLCPVDRDYYSYLYYSYGIDQQTKVGDLK